MVAADHDLFDLGDFSLQNGTTLPDAKLAFKTYGRLNADGRNAIVYPTAYGGLLADNASRIGPGKALDPDHWFVITVALFGNGQSSSPSNTPAPYGGARFPHVTVADNVRAQHRLLTARLGVGRLALAVGFSMGALQSYEWATSYPDMVDSIAPIAGAARCARHNYVFLASLKAALEADPAWNGSDYVATPTRGLRAFGRIYAGWAFSQAFYREELDRIALGFDTLEGFLTDFWEARYLTRDPNDLLAMLWTWQHADISNNTRFNGDLEAALHSIRARATVMPSASDLYFPVADSEAEVAAMRHATLAPIPSVWGHVAGNDGANAADTAFMETQLRALLVAPAPA